MMDTTPLLDGNSTKRRGGKKKDKTSKDVKKSGGKKKKKDVTKTKTKAKAAAAAPAAPPKALNFFLDVPSEMTYGRRIAHSLMKYKWYWPLTGTDNPSVDSDDDKKKNNEDDDTVIFSDSGSMDTQERATVVRPSLRKSWIYFERVTLPRFILNSSNDIRCGSMAWFRGVCCSFTGSGLTFDRAESGEKMKATRLYSPILTPLSQMGDFGLGVGLYFSSLRFFVILTFLAALLNVPVMMYYNSEEYSSVSNGIENSLLKGSAICTDTSWVPFVNGTLMDFHNDPTRFANTNTNTSSSSSSSSLPFALKNNCDGARFFQTGLYNLLTLNLLMIGLFISNILQSHEEIKFDEDEQTAQDYSLLIKNPPPTASDPDEWRDFLSKVAMNPDTKERAHVTAITIAVENDLLIRSLVERREYLQRIKLSLAPGSSVDELPLAREAGRRESHRGLFSRIVATVCHPFGIALDMPALYGRYVGVTAKIRGLAQDDYPVTNVFATFETEEAQRRCLTNLTVGKCHVWRNDGSVLRERKRRATMAKSAAALSLHDEEGNNDNVEDDDDNDWLFRGRYVMDIEEPEEPSTIRWQDVNATFGEILKPLCVTMLATLLALFAIDYFVYWLSKGNGSATVVAFAISAANSLFPIIAEILLSFELHPSVSSLQTSLFVKIAVFRWVNTTILIYRIKPFTSTLSQGESDIIPSVYKIFFADIITSNALQFFDVMGHIKRHILAPRANNQESMNQQFQGSPYRLSERYTNMTKIMFLAFYYCVIYPGAFFMCSIALLVIYYMDKFSIMRSWAPAPMIGTSIADINRRFFMPLLVFAMALMSSYMWTGFPYDNLCVTSVTSDMAQDYYGNHTITLSDGTIQNVAITSNDKFYRFCNQDLFSRPGESFPALPKDQGDDNWMTEEQEKLTKLYGWTSVAFLAYALFKFVIESITSMIDTFVGDYEQSGKIMGINFSDVPSIASYIPQVYSDQFSYPLIACSTANISSELFDWNDPDNSHDLYNLTIDAKDVLMGFDVASDSSRNAFSKVHHWPPSVGVGDDDGHRRESDVARKTVGTAAAGSIDPKLKLLLDSLEIDGSGAGGDEDDHIPPMNDSLSGFPKQRLSRY